jgi:hypothetical protein
MIKIIFTLSIFMLLWVPSQAQFLTQSADGQSSLPLPLNGMGIGFDIGKAEITFGMNNYEKLLGSQDKKFRNNYLLGFNLAVKNSEGLNNLFSAGDIVPAGNLLGFVGYSISNNTRIIDQWNKSGIVKMLQAEQITLEAQTQRLRENMLASLKECLDYVPDNVMIDSVKNELTRKINDAPAALALNEIIPNASMRNNKTLKTFFYEYITLVAARKKEILQGFVRKDLNHAIDSAFNDFTCTHIPIRITPFLLGGIQARNFTLYTGTNLSNLSGSFKDTLYRGGNIGIGVNVQVANFWFGITYSYLHGDNYANLKSKEYTLRTVDTVGNQSLASETKKTAFSGKYAKVETNQLNMDVVADFKMGDTSRLLASLYYRGSLHSRDTAYLKNYSNLGVGLYFIGKKSKFLGGLYVELPDINNNVEKAKKGEDRSIRPPFKKLTFGIVTKINLSSIFSFVNRPRTPDPK